MDFARKQMEKYGWKDGDGLGKDGNQGITVALKPRYKTGKEGMGFDLSKELVDTWWTRSYSDSLNRINVNSDDSEKVIVSTPCEDDDIEEDRPMAKMRKRMLKANFTDFTKGAILCNGELLEDDKIEDSVSVAEKNVKGPFQLTDEELLKACGGRTAHKAARFGMKLSGKLARIASQEEKIPIIPLDLYKVSLLSGTKIKKSKKRKSSENNIAYEDTVADEILSLELPIPEDDCRRKRKKKKQRDCEEETLSIVADCPVTEDHNNIKHKKSKKHKKKYQDLCE